MSPVATVLDGLDADTHNGRPVTVIISASIRDLHAQPATVSPRPAPTYPIPDVIRLAANAYQHLTVFYQVTGRPLWLGRTKRVATTDQRIVLHAMDRGCGAPGCDVPGYLYEVHQCEEGANDGRTNIDNPTFACGPHGEHNAA